ncbi:TOBE-like domain-containing protein [Micromonospora nigra]|uniref:TOBE-like domain-containing protein n=1 Tax=Micromonospora nigra TaxID=145857 RepID=UPI0015864B2F
MAGRVTRTSRVGFENRVEVTTVAGQVVTVTLTRDEFLALGLHDGASVPPDGLTGQPHGRHHAPAPPVGVTEPRHLTLHHPGRRRTPGTGPGRRPPRGSAAPSDGG